MCTNKNKQLGSASSRCPYQNDDNSLTQPTPVKIRVSLFFDGTANNKFNSSKNKDSLWFYQKAKSYGNALTNIAILSECLLADGQKADGFDFNNKIYITGVGTETYKYDHNTIVSQMSQANQVKPAGDSIFGLAMGTGPTGIIETQTEEPDGDDVVSPTEILIGGKVKDALDELFSYVTATVDKSIQPIMLLSINVFGFSRGAAAARTFIHYLMDDPNEKMQTRLAAQGYSVSQIQVFFSGLFDTVSSFGLPYFHKYNTQYLHLDAIAKSSNVIHLTAKDEFREYFSLTNIKSKGAEEIPLPGAHADIGGGYNDGDGESVTLLELIKPIAASGMEPGFFDTMLATENEHLMKSEIDRITSEGWYNKNEIEIRAGYKLIGKRANISNKYSLIPLHIMKTYAQNLGALKFSNDIESMYKVPDDDPDLLRFQAKITATGKGTYDDDFELLKKIRHNYFHTSADFDSTGMSPNYINGKKERHIADG